jgi:hypothetical protein
MKFSQFVVTVLFLGSSVMCRATITSVNQTITLNSAFLSSSGGFESYGQSFSPTSPFIVHNGDEITGTINFTGGPIFIESPSGSFNESLVLFFSPVSGSVGTTETNNIDFLGLQGVFGTTNPIPVGSSSGCCFIAAQFSNGNAFDFSFTSFTYTINVTSLTATTQFYLSSLSLQGQVIELGVSAPEPSPFVLCGVGFGVLGWVAWRRKSILSRAGG